MDTLIVLDEIILKVWLMWFPEPCPTSQVNYLNRALVLLYYNLKPYFIRCLSKSVKFWPKSKSLFYPFFIWILILSNVYPNPWNIQTLSEIQQRSLFYPLFIWIPILSNVYPNPWSIQTLSKIQQRSLFYPLFVQIQSLSKVYPRTINIHCPSPTKVCLSKWHIQISSNFCPSHWFVQSLSREWIHSLSKVYLKFIQSLSYLHPDQSVWIKVWFLKDRGWINGRLC